MKNGKPLVSVVMPVYNGQKYLEEAVRSILSQTYGKLELILVDDGSSDQTAKMIRKYGKQYPQIVKAVILRKNCGESAASNVGFLRSKGQFISRMDADDVAYPEKIKKQVEFMLQNPDLVVLGTQADVINEEGKVVGKKTFPQTHKSIYRKYGVYHPMLHPSCLFRRDLLPFKNKLWENTHEPNDDYVTLFRLLNRGKFANLPESLVGYRIHGSNKSLANARSKVFNALRIRIYAIRELGYKPTPFAIFMNIVQLVGVLVLPESLIVPLYNIMRGVIQPDFGFLRKYPTPAKSLDLNLHS